MEPAIMGAIIIAYCFAAGVFETSKHRTGKRPDADVDQEQEGRGTHEHDA